MPRQMTPTRPATAAGTITVNRSAIPTPPPIPGRATLRTSRAEEELPLKPSASCATHGRFWPLLEVAGRPVCPVEAIEAIKAGMALEDPEAAHDAIVRLERNARMPSVNTGGVEAIDLIQGGHDLTADGDGNLLVSGRPEHWFGPGELALTYHAVVGADAHRRNVEAARRAAEAAGMEPGDNVAPGLPKMLTPEEVCAILQVSPRTLDRIAGQSIPAPLHIGGQRRWNSVVLAHHLSRAA